MKQEVKDKVQAIMNEIVEDNKVIFTEKGKELFTNISGLINNHVSFIYDKINANLVNRVNSIIDIIDKEQSTPQS